MKSRHRQLVRIAAVLASVVFLFTTAAASAAAAGAPDAPPLTIFLASTLSGYVRDLDRSLRARDPGVALHAEGSGSLDAIRKVTDFHMPCDILLSADWRLLDAPLAGVEPWVAVFAGNSMALLYTSRSRYANEITPDNWFRVLLRPGVRYGHSDPERDPEGYWTLIVWKLAERYYNQPGLAAKLHARCPRSATRPASVNLMALLQAGELDYYFGYASDARLGNLKVLRLPDAINLSDFSRATEYAKVSVEIGHGAHRKRVTGAPIAYGASMTAKPRNRKAALEFLRLMFGAEGRRAAARNGLVPYQHVLALDPKGAMPPALKSLTTPFSPK
jgi:molybdate/tungstate transport system substrate-binding protein